MTGIADIASHPLPVLLVLGPLLAAAAVRPLGRWSPRLRNAYVLGVSGTTLLGAAALLPLVAANHRVGAEIPAMIGRLTFVADPFGMVFALFATFVWFCATLYSFDYLKHHEHRDLYHSTSLVVLASMLGVVLAGDLVTLYLFFEALGLVAFLFVIHARTAEASRASVTYLWMTVLGGFALIGGIFLTQALGGDASLGPLPLSDSPETLRWITFGLLVGGFGVKAGMVPVHVWLPDAHPVAPAPASALLSGVMIKAGAYGIFRTVSALFRPEVVADVSEQLWHMTASFGLTVLWLGIATMAIGVVLALGQHDAKRMLAYHSVSQMGFILVGIGAAGYIGLEGAMGTAGGLFHAANHALFKSALFLGIGAVVYRTGRSDMYELGGLWRKMPWTFAFMLVAAAGITGVPLFNGFVSKCLVHHALEQAYEVQHLASLDIAEKIYLVTCGGTACSFIKLIGLVFFGKPEREYGPEVADPPPRMLVALGILAAAIVVLGVRPGLLLKGLLGPGLIAWALPADGLDYYLDVYFLSPADLMSTVIAFAIGAVAYAIGMRFGLFHLRAPSWFGVHYWYRAFANGFIDWSSWAGRAHRAYLDAVSRSVRNALLGIRSLWHLLERDIDHLAVVVAAGTPGIKGRHFVRTAHAALDREREVTVRYAVTKAHTWLQKRDDFSAQRAHETLEAVRDIAAHMTRRQHGQRTRALAEMVRSGEVEAVRRGFEHALHDIRVFRSEVAHTALELAEQRMCGLDVVDQMSAAVDRLSEEERFDQRLRTARHHLPPTHPGVHDSLGEGVTRATGALGRLRVRWFGRVEAFLRWGIELVRLVIEAATEEHSRWSVPQQIDPDTVLKTRRQIQRYARDTSLGIAAIVVVFLLVMTAIVAGSGR